jgi:sulfite oxidase
VSDPTAPLVLVPAGKRQDLVVHEEAPLNAEPPRAALAGSVITPLDAFYVRNHGNIPDAQADWRLSVGGLVERPLDLGLDELRDGRFEICEIVATLQCAGNRRTGLIAVRDIPGEAPWGPGATSTARWRGVRLRDIIDAAGDRGATDVGFAGADHSDEAQPPQRYGASIPIHKARGDEVLLAWSMNDEPLPAVHGAPVRAVVPGWIGARSVKWLTTIELRDRPWDGYFQQTVYRLLPPGVEAAPGVGIALGEVALNSDVLAPDGTRPIPAGQTTITGYAVAGGDRRVVRVDVSIDGGRAWQQADLLDDEGRWAWRHWQLIVDLDPGQHEIVVRAWDSAAALQPEDPASLWNPKGYVNNAWARVRVDVLED